MPFWWVLGEGSLHNHPLPWRETNDIFANSINGKKVNTSDFVPSFLNDVRPVNQVWVTYYLICVLLESTRLPKKWPKGHYVIRDLISLNIDWLIDKYYFTNFQESLSSFFVYQIIS